MPGLGDTTTARLHLRPISEADTDALHAVFAKPEVWRYPYGRGFDRDETAAFVARQADGWRRDGFGLWLVSVLGNGTTVGFTGLSVPTFLPEILPAVEVGWRLDPDVWGRGYATEAARAALAGAFTILGLDRVCCIPQVGNDASIRVAERLDLRLVRPVVIPETEQRGPLEAVLYEMTAGEWADGQGTVR